jgi:hypothetical protein
LRCWQQKRRFGFELLYPTTRYSDGLRNTIIRNRANQEVANPLFAASNGKTGRDKGLVFLAGIVGVPGKTSPIKTASPAPACAT